VRASLALPQAPQAAQPIAQDDRPGPSRDDVPSGLTRAAERLVAAGLVRRDRISGDARVMLAQLTEEGRSVYAPPRKPTCAASASTTRPSSTSRSWPRSPQPSSGSPGPTSRTDPC
jgi:hypothetical protein